MAEGAKGRDALGPRALLGVLVPATNTIVQPELEAMRPAGVTLHTARVPASGRRTDDAEAYRQSLGARGAAHLAAGLSQLLPLAPDAIILGHSLDAYAGGVAGATALAAQLEASAAVPCVVPPLALAQALAALGPGLRVAVLTPYLPPGDELVAAYLGEVGVEVRRVLGLRCPSPRAIAQTPLDEIRAAFRRLDGPDVDVLLQSGTNLAAATVAAAVEAELGKPVVATNTACLWSALRRLGIEDRREGFGQLLARC